MYKSPLDQDTGEGTNDTNNEQPQDIGTEIVPPLTKETEDASREIGSNNGDETAIDNHSGSTDTSNTKDGIEGEDDEPETGGNEEDEEDIQQSTGIDKGWTGADRLGT